MDMDMDMDMDMAGYGQINYWQPLECFPNLLCVSEVRLKRFFTKTIPNQTPDVHDQVIFELSLSVCLKCLNP